MAINLRHAHVLVANFKILVTSKRGGFSAPFSLYKKERFFDMVDMGFGFNINNACFKRKNRWLFVIPGVSADLNSVDALPPSKAMRPNLSFKEIEVQHLNETIYFPGRAEWKPVNLSLYDLKKNNNAVFKWLSSLYSAAKDKVEYKHSCDGFKIDASLILLDGCGNNIEEWKFENIWPQQIEFGDLDMSVGDVVICELTLRYDRAYIV